MFKAFISDVWKLDVNSLKAGLVFGLISGLVFSVPFLYYMPNTTGKVIRDITLWTGIIIGCISAGMGFYALFGTAVSFSLIPGVAVVMYIVFKSGSGELNDVLNFGIIMSLNLLQSFILGALVNIVFIFGLKFVLHRTK